MSQSLSKLYVHIIFHIQWNGTPIQPEHANELYAYMGSVIGSHQCLPIQIGGMADHVHVLCTLSKNVALAKLVEDVKRHGSRWIKGKSPYYRNFAWQGGYSAFSVSASVVDKTRSYIRNQPAHHRKRSYQEELTLFLEEYDIRYEEKYLFEGGEG